MCFLQICPKEGIYIKYTPCLMKQIGQRTVTHYTKNGNEENQQVILNHSYTLVIFIHLIELFQSHFADLVHQCSTNIHICMRTIKFFKIQHLCPEVSTDRTVDNQKMNRIFHPWQILFFRSYIYIEKNAQCLNFTNL